MYSWVRKLKDPFVVNEVTQKAALATLKAAKRRSGWPETIGLRGGAPGVKRAKSEAVPSKQSIIGRFEGNDSELLISVYNGELTIVKRGPSDIHVNRSKVADDTRTISTGEALEKSDFGGEEEVFKKFWLRGGIGENEIEVDNYRIENPARSPTHSSKLIGVVLYHFLNDNGVEKVKVILSKFLNQRIMPKISDF
jgi:hypothetical protein